MGEESKMSIEKTKELHTKLTNAFVYAFTELRNSGGNIKDIFWFKSEKEKEKDES